MTTPAGPGAASGRALVVGEALVDVVEPASNSERGHERASNSEQDGPTPAEYVGGSPLNVAVGLGRLDRGVDFLTHVGRDRRGDRIVDHLDRAGVRLVAGSREAARTATAVARLDAAGSATYEFDLEWRVSDVPEVAPPLVAHTGSIGAFLAPGCVAVAALLDACRTAATITYDPNVRPALIRSRAEAVARIELVVERADVVKASEEDLRWLDPTRPPEQVAAAWLALGPAVVVVTLGDRGAIAVCAAGHVSVPALPVDVVDTVGAGDAFMTGLIDALWTMDLLGGARRTALAGIDAGDLAEVLRAASRVSALTVARAGARLPDRAALQHGWSRG